MFFENVAEHPTRLTANNHLWWHLALHRWILATSFTETGSDCGSAITKSPTSNGRLNSCVAQCNPVLDSLKVYCTVLQLWAKLFLGKTKNGKLGTCIPVSTFDLSLKCLFYLRKSETLKRKSVFDSKISFLSVRNNFGKPQIMSHALPLLGDNGPLRCQNFHFTMVTLLLPEGKVWFFGSLYFC